MFTLSSRSISSHNGSCSIVMSKSSINARRERLILFKTCLCEDGEINPPPAVAAVDDGVCRGGDDEGYTNGTCEDDTVEGWVSLCKLLLLLLLLLVLRGCWLCSWTIVRPYYASSFSTCCNCSQRAFCSRTSAASRFYSISVHELTVYFLIYKACLRCSI